MLINQYLFAQEISGIVSKNNNIPIENVNVSIWNSDKKEILFGYIYTNEKGFFVIKIKSQIKDVFIEVSCLDFATTNKKMTISGTNQTINFVLEAKKTELEEVVVKDEKAIRVKNDTTFYDPKKFLNGTERKVEDLVKRLPGMTVNEKTGEIKYKGKAIETVKLEDDDLFGGNYSIGTKNISVDMVEQLQAIENYSDNPLLKGIENSGKVAINLKLKKQKTDYSGTVEAKNGFSDKILFNDEITLLGISKTIKSFGIATINNFGGGTFDINSFSQGFNSIEIPEKEFYSKKLLSEPSINSTLPENLTKFNNSLFSNYNIIYKLSKKISIKKNLIYLYDSSNAFENYQNIFFSNNSNFETNQENFFNKKAYCFKADLKLTYNINKKSLSVSSISFSRQTARSSLNSLQNNLNLFQNDLQTNNLFFKARTDYTLRINDKKAIRYYLEFSKNDIPQELMISPNNGLFNSNSSVNVVQKSNFTKQTLSNKITFLEIRKNFKQSISLGFISESNPLKSNLNDNISIVDGFENNINYKKTNLFWEYFTSFSFYKIKIQPFVSSNFYNQNLIDKNSFLEIKKSSLVYNANLSMSVGLNKYGDFFITGNSENKTPEEELLFANKILENNNSVKSNIPSLEFLKSKSVMIGYKYYDLRKQFGFDTNLKFEKQENTFISNISINQNFTAINYFQNPTNIDNVNLFLSFEKQIPILNLYLKQTTLFSISNYKNAIDNFILRNNKSQNLNSSILVFSSFNFPVNFDNKLNYNLANFRSDNSFENQRISINNTFKLILKTNENWIYSITHDYFLTDIKLNNNFNFIDFDLKYKSPKLKWFSLSFTGKNLLNIKTFSETNNSDFSSSIYSTNLLPRYFLVSGNFSF